MQNSVRAKHDQVHLFLTMVCDTRTMRSRMPGAILLYDQLLFRPLHVKASPGVRVAMQNSVRAKHAALTHGRVVLNRPNELIP